MPENQLQVIVQQSGLEATKAQFILAQFQNYFDIAADWEVKAKGIIVTDGSQTAEMAMARAGRLFLKEKRIAIENARKQLKEQALREGKAIDGISNVLKALIVPIEEYLDKQEHFVEIRQKEAEARRLVEEAEKAEKERLAKEAEEQAERERIRKENEKLRQEAEEKDRLMAEQKAKAEADRRTAEEEAAKAKRVADKKLADERAKADREREIAEKKQREAEAEIERLNRDAEIKRLKEERQAKSVAVGKRLVECPNCHAEFEIDESAGNG